MSAIVQMWAASLSHRSPAAARPRTASLMLQLLPPAGVPLLFPVPGINIQKFNVSSTARLRLLYGVPCTNSMLELTFVILYVKWQSLNLLLGSALSSCLAAGICYLRKCPSSFITGFLMTLLLSLCCLRLPYHRSQLQGRSKQLTGISGRELQERKNARAQQLVLCCTWCFVCKAARYCTAAW